MRTSAGRVRANNEDAAFVDPDGRFFIVADGMGGHSAGEVASALAVKTVRKTLESAKRGLDTFAEQPSHQGRAWVQSLLEHAVQVANTAVLMAGDRVPSNRGMGTTVDVALVLGHEAFLAHVGDGRTYLLRDGGARLETVDHTAARAMLRAGALTIEEADRSALRSVLSNALGCAPDVQIDHARVELRPGDRLLMCTDGLYDYFRLDEIAERACSATADAALDRLLDDACKRGGHDNMTGILVELGATAAPVEALDDEITTPMRICVPALPLADVSDDALGEVVDEVLRESSEPYVICDG